MVGKGSVNHNSRKFKAENVDGERSHFNVDYCNENIKKVYHKLFDEALQRYNDKQTRTDRRISDYYDKIRNSKQEKTFHELILQIGDKENIDVYKRQQLKRLIKKIEVDKDGNVDIYLRLLGDLGLNESILVEDECENKTALNSNDQT